MTFEKACELANVKPSDFLFDGKQNTLRYYNASFEAFGIVEAEDICSKCIHSEDCPFRAEGNDKYIECNFYEE